MIECIDMESMKNPQLGVQEAYAQIEGIRQQAMAMGANDYEPSAFDGVLRALTNGDISPAEAVQQAEAIIGSKQSYH